MDQENEAIIIAYFTCIVVLRELKMLYNDTSASLFSCQTTEGHSPQEVALFIRITDLVEFYLTRKDSQRSKNFFTHFIEET